jgi:translation initiation factor IF-3
MNTKPQTKNSEPRVNKQITSQTVRVVDEEGGQLGIMSITDALEKAESLELDLIEISPEANPPVVKVIDYGKWKYKKEKLEQKSGKEKKSIKEVRFSISISDNDLNTKISMIQKFLKQGDNVLVKVILKGREHIKYELGSKRMQSILNSLKGSYKNSSEIKSEKNAIQCTLFA